MPLQGLGSLILGLGVRPPIIFSSLRDRILLTNSYIIRKNQVILIVPQELYGFNYDIVVVIHPYYHTNTLYLYLYLLSYLAPSFLERYQY